MLLPLGISLWTGCAGPASSVTAEPATNPCLLLPLHAYSPEVNAALADEIQAAPVSAEWPDVVRDYVALRDAVKACRAVK
jgi:hypothetical protein